MAFFLDALRPELGQGDIVRICAYGSLPELHVIRRWQKDPTNATLFPHPLTTTPKRPPTPPLFSRQGAPEDVVFEAFEGGCVVVSNDCVAIAKAANQADTLRLTERQKSVPWHVAPLRPWPAPTQMVETPGGKKSLGALIAAGLVKKYWEVPPFNDGAGKEIVPRSYADLRFLTPLKPSALRIHERIASLSDEGVGELWAKLFVFFSGKALPKRVRCRHCGEMSDLELDDLIGDENAQPAEG